MAEPYGYDQDRKNNIKINNLFKERHYPKHVRLYIVQAPDTGIETAKYVATDAITTNPIKVVIFVKVSSLGTSPSLFIALLISPVMNLKLHAKSKKTTTSDTIKLIQHISLNESNIISLPLF
jgi:hypothetical protein